MTVCQLRWELEIFVDIENLRKEERERQTVKFVVIYQDVKESC
jgi:hypothetical protein